MSKAVKTVAAVIGVAALVIVTGGAALALAGGFAVGGVTFFGGISMLTMAKIAALGVSIGFAGGVKPNLDMTRQMAANLSTFSSPSAIRSVIFGRALVGGQIIFRENIDNSNLKNTPDELLMVVALAGYPVDSLERIFLNDVSVFTGSTTTGPGAITTGKFANNLWVWFRTGSETTAAFPEIAALSSTWNAKVRKGRGIPAIALRIKVTEALDGKVEPLFQVKGAKLYDPRLDTTAGGSGAHRIADPTTWAWSENPILAALFYLIGAKVNGKTKMGMFVPTARIDLETFATEASVCEETVAVKAGGTIPRYTCNGVLVPEATHRDNLRQILSACAGSIDASDGSYQVFAGAWRAPSMTLTEADVDLAPSDIQLEKDPSAEINVVRGSFTSLAARQIIEYPERRDPTSIAKFGERSILLDFPFTNDHRIVQRLTKIEMLRANAQRFFSANYWLRAIPLQPGDIVKQTYLRYGFDEATMRVNAWGLEPATDSAGNPKLVVAMQLVEEREEWFDWDAATEEADLSSGEPGLLPAGKSSPRLDSLLGSVDKAQISRDVSGQNLLGRSNIAFTNDSDAFFVRSETVTLADLGMAPGDLISFGAAGEITAGDTARTFRVRLVFAGPGSVVEGNGVVDGLSAIQGAEIPSGATGITFHWLRGGSVATNTIAVSGSMANRGPVLLPFEQPPTRVNRGEVEEGADVTAAHASDITFAAAGAPSSPQTGWIWTDTSTEPWQVKRWSGSAWVTIATLNSGALANLNTVTNAQSKIYTWRLRSGLPAFNRENNTSGQAGPRNPTAWFYRYSTFSATYLQGGSSSGEPYPWIDSRIELFEGDTLVATIMLRTAMEYGAAANTASRSGNANLGRTFYRTFTAEGGSGLDASGFVVKIDGITKTVWDGTIVFGADEYATGNYGGDKSFYPITIEHTASGTIFSTTASVIGLAAATITITGTK
jgi:hypothetical protein